MQTFAALKKERVTTGRKIFDLIKPELMLVEAEFERQARSNIQVINYLGDYLRASGGKRVRPALLLLSAYAVGGDGKAESAIRMATVMEMLHTATLVHDDIIDNANLRRNRETVNARFGNQAAVLMGDWLYMSAFETALKERSLPVLDVLTRLTRQMAEGELIQLTVIGSPEITEEEYFDILRRKTAYLMSGCCEIGAIISGADAATQAAMREYGMNLGIAFQLADDLLDFTASDSTLGKAAGADLLEGKITLPLIYLLKAEPSIKPILETVMIEGRYGADVRETLMHRLAAHKTLETIRTKALGFADSARKSLEILPQSEYSFALDEIPSFVINRSN
jgi:octaprenyl-diphosphate synthase